MQQNYDVVPSIISCKDLDYLSDMFAWNYGVLKNTNEAINKVRDNDIKELLIKSFNIFNDNLNNILSILKGGSNEQQ